MNDPITGVETVPPPVITEMPEFKAALKREREQLEQNIRESNQTHLAKKEQELEERYRTSPAPVNGGGKDYFVEWGERHGLPPEAGRELAGGILGHIQTKVLPDQLTPITERQKWQDIRAQRQELRAANAKLAKLDDRYHVEAMAMVEALKPEQVGSDSYAKALHMVIGSHVEELMETPVATEPVREIVPGPEPAGSAPAPKKKVSLNAEQKRFVDERGMEEENFVEMMRARASALEAKGQNKAQVRARLGPLLGTIEF